ncbi:hypothetical protein C7M61_004579 [Candidozyma pseudohaemuli]|uniref:RNA-polymerase II-associated protein 3-like C-terminal domain-containing protein n=1 Tax=Candidozyma pseudohaemuli TaxID=418784 RepID=A0A2P7YHA2_9ASCO|nr:hypothetical protein C7M61_004579 [[Candida] pseudohaemulonii]PSK35334.1 hypothetical protein C7M61_004579 [[Candida] pseudohaemulonii]
MPTLDEYKAQGNKAFVEKQYQKAIDFYSQAIALDKENPVLYSNRAQCHLNLRDWIRASNDVEVGLRLNPNEKIKVKLLYRKGLTAKGSGSVVMAKRAFNEALELDPNNQAAASELEQLEPKKPKTENSAPVNVPIEIVDELPEEFRRKLDGKPAVKPLQPSQSSSADVDAIASELFGNKKKTPERESPTPQPKTAFADIPTMHVLSKLSSLPPERKANGYKVVLQLEKAQIEEMFAYSGLDSEFFDFFLEAAAYFLPRHSEITAEQLVDRLEYMKTLKRFDLVKLLAPDSLIHRVIEAVQEERAAQKIRDLLRT